jgi:ELWxxDGT repeat protein
MVRDSIPGKDGVLPDQLTAVGGRLFFNGYDDAHGEELWTSDGTAAGTHLVKDLAPGRRPGSLGDLTAFDGGVFFFSSGLFRSDGTSAGTVRVKGGLGGEGMVVVGTTLFVFTDDALWKSDGTSVGTVVVKSGPLEWLPEPGSSIGSTEFFTAADDVHGRELWSTDGTDPGTRLVRDIWPGPNPPAFVLAPGPFATAGATLLFGADDGAHGSELWRSDGTKAGTALVRDIAG